MARLNTKINEEVFIARPLFLRAISTSFYELFFVGDVVFMKETEMT